MNEKYELMNDKNECSFLENEVDDECLFYEDGTCGKCNTATSDRYVKILDFSQWQRVESRN